MAKPMPTLPPEGEKIIEFMPITWPRRSKVGPPELPRLMGASIWMKSVYCWPLPMSRPMRRDDAGGHRIGEAERIAHRDHPVADAQLLVVAEFDGRQRLVAVDLEQGDVGGGSVPISLAVKLRPSGSLTVIFLPSSTTWLLVTMKPDLSMMKPEPARSPCAAGRCWPWPNWLKKSRNGAGRSSALIACRCRSRWSRR